MFLLLRKWKRFVFIGKSWVFFLYFEALIPRVWVKSLYPAHPTCLRDNREKFDEMLLDY